MKTISCYDCGYAPPIVQQVTEWGIAIVIDEPTRAFCPPCRRTYGRFDIKEW